MIGWVETLLVSDDTASMVLGIAVVGFVAYIAWYLGTVVAETIVAVIERRR